MSLIKSSTRMSRGTLITMSLLLLLFGLISCKNDTKPSNQTGSGDGLLSYVPADSIIFIGGLEAFSVKESAQMFGENSGFILQTFKEGMQKSPNADNSPPAVKLFSQLVLDYLQAMENPDQLAQKIGLPENVQFAMYSVGTMPVLRMGLKDKAAFEAFIQNSETQASVKSDVISVGSAKIRKYPFETTPDPKSPGISLVIGVQGDDAIFTVYVEKLGEEMNRQIIGDIKPANALNPAILSDLADKYHFDKRYLLYVDHKQIMRGLTHSDNHFGSMLNSIIQMAKKSKLTEAAAPGVPGEEVTGGMPAAEPDTGTAEENPLAKIQTPECQQELTAKVETWPRTVGGYTTLDFKNKPAKFDFKSIVEINDAKFSQSLATLRGVIPSYMSNRDIPMLFGIGVGLNVDAIAPVVTQFIQEFTAQDYKCQFLAEMKQNLQQNNPAMGIAMMSGMAAGVYGISASLLSFDGKIDPTMQMPPDVKNFQAIVTVSAKNPQMLLMMLSKMQPGMPPLELPADGGAIDFPLPLPSPEPIKLALKGNHIVAYSGKDALALADAMPKQDLQGNGLVTFNIDYQKYLKLVMGAMPAAAAQDPEMQKMTKLFENMKYRVIEGLDVSDKGIEFNANMTVN